MRSEHSPAEGKMKHRSVALAQSHPSLKFPAGARQVAPLETDTELPEDAEAAAGVLQANGTAQGGGDPRGGTLPPLAPGGHLGVGRRSGVSALAAAVGVLGRLEAARDAAGDGGAAEVTRCAPSRPMTTGSTTCWQRHRT